MNILIDNKISQTFQQLFLAAEKVDLITAYLTSGIFNIIEDNQISNKNISLFLRGNRKDFQSRACDIHVLEKLYRLGVKCFLVKDLHSKVYIFDQKVALVGSANLTNRGLGFASHGNNIECLCEYNISDQSYLEFLKMLKGAVIVDEAILNFICLALDEKNKNNDILSNDEWDFLLQIKRVGRLTINDLPFYDLNKNTNDIESYRHDQIILGLDEDLKKFREKFKQSNLYFYIRDLLQKQENKQIFFGEFSKIVHDDLLFEQDLSRRAVKQYIINIYNYFKILDLDNIKVDRPNYSERIYFVD